mgnify:CR=1 FL=1
MLARDWTIALLFVSVVISCGKKSEDSTDGGAPGPAFYSDSYKEADSSDAREIVSKCLAAKSATTTDKVVASKSISEGPYAWSSSGYSLAIPSSKQAITLKAALVLDYEGTAVLSADEMARRMDLQRLCFQKFYWRHSIDLKLTLYREGETGIPKDTSVITIREMGERGESFNVWEWAFGMGGKSYPLDTICSTMLHEFGHVLGFPDEYEDSKVPDRVLGDKDSIMRSAWTTPDALKLYPRHIEPMLSPLCK